MKNQQFNLILSERYVQIVPALPVQPEGDKIFLILDAGFLSKSKGLFKNSNIYKIKISHLVSSLRIASMIPGDRKVAGCLSSFSRGGDF